jgi:hypothetical protein
MTPWSKLRRMPLRRQQEIVFGVRNKIAKPAIKLKDLNGQARNAG